MQISTLCWSIGIHLLCKCNFWTIWRTVLTRYQVDPNVGSAPNTFNLSSPAEATDHSHSSLSVRNLHLTYGAMYPD